MNENKIRGLILERYPTITAFAKAVGWTRQKASSIIRIKQEPSLDDCYAIARAVDKDANEIASIFLQMKTQKCVQKTKGDTTMILLGFTYHSVMV